MQESTQIKLEDKENDLVFHVCRGRKKQMVSQQTQTNNFGINSKLKSILQKQKSDGNLNIKENIKRSIY